jgi:hypothetical protein
MNPAAAGVVVCLFPAGPAPEGHKLVSYGSIPFDSSRPWRESEVVSSHPSSVPHGIPASIQCCQLAAHEHGHPASTQECPSQNPLRRCPQGRYAIARSVRTGWCAAGDPGEVRRTDTGRSQDACRRLDQSDGHSWPCGSWYAVLGRAKVPLLPGELQLAVRQDAEFLTYDPDAHPGG